MTSHRCRRCGHWWASDSPAKTWYITNFCPTCIPKISHPLTHDSPTIRAAS